MPKQTKKQVTFAGDPKKVKKEIKTKDKPDLSWWKDHCKWLNTFRGKIVNKNDRHE